MESRDASLNNESHQYNFKKTGSVVILETLTVNYLRCSQNRIHKQILGNLALYSNGWLDFQHLIQITTKIKSQFPTFPTKQSVSRTIFSIIFPELGFMIIQNNYSLRSPISIYFLIFTMQTLLWNLPLFLPRRNVIKSSRHWKKVACYI